jgi:hypothetical protein
LFFSFLVKRDAGPFAQFVEDSDAFDHAGFAGHRQRFRVPALMWPMSSHLGSLKYVMSCLLF